MGEGEYAIIRSVARDINPSQREGDFLPYLLSELAQVDARWRTYRTGGGRVEIELPDAAFSVGLSVLRHINDRYNSEHVDSTNNALSVNPPRSTPENIQAGINSFRRRQNLEQSLMNWAFGDKVQVDSMLGEGSYSKLCEWIMTFWDMKGKGFGSNWGDEYFLTEFLVGLSRLSKLAVSVNGITSHYSPDDLLAQEREASLQEVFRHGFKMQTGPIALGLLERFPVPIDRLSQILEVHGSFQGINYRMRLTTPFGNDAYPDSGLGKIYIEPDRSSKTDDRIITLRQQAIISKVLYDTGVLDVAEQWRVDKAYLQSGGNMPPKDFYILPNAQNQVLGSFQGVVELFQTIEELGVIFEGGSVYHVPSILSFSGLSADEVKEVVDTMNLEKARIRGYSSGWMFMWKIIDGELELDSEQSS